MRGEQAIFNLEIKKKSGLSINPDIHHSKVFSSCYFRKEAGPNMIHFIRRLKELSPNMIVSQPAYGYPQVQ